jgi:hypothetical protein
MGPLDGVVIEMECPRCESAAIKIDDPRCSGLMMGVAIQVEDIRCTSLVEGLTLEVDDARCWHLPVRMEDPRCRSLQVVW